MRCFFHLVSNYETILDDTGIEVPNLETYKAVRELRQEMAGAGEDWKGWRLEIVCAEEGLLYTMDLDISLH
jgi:hypothetical protein